MECLTGSFLCNAITLDFAVKAVAAAVLFFTYQENRNRIFFYWTFAWLFFALTAFIDVVAESLPYTYFLIGRNVFLIVTAVFFYFGICNLINRKKLKNWGIIFGILLSVFVIVNVLFLKDGHLASLVVQLVVGSSLVIGGISFYHVSINKSLLYNKLTTLGFILNGLHNLDYPFLVRIKWFAPYGFLLCALFSAIFALGMIMRSTAEMRRQRKTNLENIRELATLYTLTSTVCRSKKLDQILYSVLDSLIRTLRMDNGLIFLLDKAGDNLQLKAHRGLSKKTVEVFRKQPMKNSFASRAIEKNKIYAVERAKKKESAFKKQIIDENVDFIVCVPLRSGNKVLGVIEVGSKTAKKLTSQDMRLLESVGNELGVAIDNKKLAENLEGVYLSTILTLTDMVEAKDHYTRSHSDEVARYAVMTAKEMDLPEDNIEQIRMASQLHDLGKIAVSDLILLKEGKLTDKEWEEIKKHPEKAVEILKPLHFLHGDNGVLEYIRSHHERFDGKGYPNGYKEGEIKLGARIMSVADSYHAMTSARPYRKKALTPDEAKEELRRNAGKQFDPDVVEAFLKALEKMEKNKENY
jgi:HD-GYP domain-containing protein (c-di-GMP phosphodiesterase class II)